MVSGQSAPADRPSLKVPPKGTTEADLLGHCLQARNQGGSRGAFEGTVVFCFFVVVELFRMASSELPISVIRAMEKQGAAVTNHGTVKKPLFLIETCAASDAHRHCEQHCIGDGSEACEDDPLVGLVLPAATWGVIPPVALYGAINNEVGAILLAYQPLMRNAFAPGLPLPIVGPPMALGFPIPYHHAKISAHRVIEHISNPGLAAAPTIHGLANGTMVPIPTQMPLWPCVLHAGR
jgi:hypothetical protein